MPMQATPQNLQQIWSLPVGAFNPGLRQFEQMQEMDSQKMAADAAAEAYRAQERPLTLEQLAGQNRNRNAELPGIQARSRLATNQADKADNTFDSDLEAYFAQNRGKIQKEQFESALRAGPLLLQFAEMAAYNPQSIPQIRQRMIDMGVGDAWNPEWDKANPRDVAAGMYDFGTSLSHATPAMQKLMAQLESKESIAADKNATTLAAQEMRSRIQREVASIRKSSGGGTKTASKLEALATAIRTQAMGTKDPTAREQLMSQYYEIMDEAWSYKNRETVPRNVLNPETGKIELTKPATSPFKDKVPATNPIKEQPKLGTKENPIKLD